MNEDETFSAVLSRYTGRTVYNFGLSGGSPREMLYILREDKETLEALLIPKPDKDVQYVIFTYIGDQHWRLYGELRDSVPNFKFSKRKNALYYYKDAFWEKFLGKAAIYRYLSYIYANKKAKKENLGLFCVYMKEIEKEIHKQFGEKTKLIVFVFQMSGYENWDLLKNEGIKVIKLTDMINIDVNERKYRGKDNWHPSTYAWEVIVPALAKELDL